MARGVPMERSNIGMAVNPMNKEEKRIASRMLADLQVAAQFAVTQRTRVVTLARRDVIRELIERFDRHNYRVKNARRERHAKNDGSKTKTKRNTKAEVVTGHDLHGHH